MPRTSDSSVFTSFVKSMAQVNAALSNPPGSFVPSRSSVALINVSAVSAMITTSKFTRIPEVTKKSTTITPKSSTIPIISAVGQDIFIAKHGADGSILWATRISGTGDEFPYQSTGDSVGAVYVTGYTFNSPTLTVYNADGTVFNTFTNLAGYDGFIVKYNKDGLGQWVSRISGVGYDAGYTITTDVNGYVYMAGYYESGAKIYNIDGTVFRTLTSIASTEASIIKYDSNGSIQWFTRIAGNGADTVWGITTDLNGDVYLTGWYDSMSMTMYNSDNTASSNVLTSGTYIGYSAFVAKYNSSGFAQWITTTRGPNSDSGLTITTGPSGSIYAGGRYGTSTVTFYNVGQTVFGTRTSIGTNDGFLTKYNTAGAIQWVAQIGGPGNDRVYSVVADLNDNIYIGGEYNTDAVVYNSNGTIFTTLTTGGSNEGFLVKYNSDGLVQWCTRIGGAVCVVNMVNLDTIGNIYIAGNYDSGAKIYNADGSIFATPINNGANDAIVVKYNPSGFAQFYARISGSGNETLRGVNTDSNGNIITLGQYTGAPIAYSQGQ